jgi:hypothetical protein
VEPNKTRYCGTFFWDGDVSCCFAHGTATCVDGTRYEGEWLEDAATADNGGDYGPWSYSKYYFRGKKTLPDGTFTEGEFPHDAVGKQWEVGCHSSPYPEPAVKVPKRKGGTGKRQKTAIAEAI